MLPYIVGVYYDEGPPVPIPNTVVKLIRAENTWRAASRENRSMPTLKNRFFGVCFFIPFFLSGRRPTYIINYAIDYIIDIMYNI